MTPTETTLTPPARKFVRAEEVAEYLGVHISTVRRWCSTGKLPCIISPGDSTWLIHSDWEKRLQEKTDEAQKKHRAAARARALREASARSESRDEK